MAIVGSTLVVQGEKSTILVELDALPKAGGWGPDAETRGDRVQRVMQATRDVFGDGLALARDCAARTVDSLDQTADKVRPDEFELQLCIKLDAEAGAVVTKVGAGAHMQVTMRWKRPPAP